MRTDPAPAPPGPRPDTSRERIERLIELTGSVPGYVVRALLDECDELKVELSKMAQKVVDERSDCIRAEAEVVELRRSQPVVDLMDALRRALPKESA